MPLKYMYTNCLDVYLQENCNILLKSILILHPEISTAIPVQKKTNVLVSLYTILMFLNVKNN
jgi:hypothetical protein